MVNDGLFELERAIRDAGEVNYRLRLYTSGITPRSINAVAAIKKLCDERLVGRCQLEIIDLHQQPQLARQDQIVAVPTLVKLAPEPVKRFVGDMTQLDRVVRGLNL
jgi:circadian clock protein KaiB